MTHDLDPDARRRVRNCLYVLAVLLVLVGAIN